MPKSREPQFLWLVFASGQGCVLAWWHSRSLSVDGSYQPLIVPTAWCDLELTSDQPFGQGSSIAVDSDLVLSAEPTHFETEETENSACSAASGQAFR